MTEPILRKRRTSLFRRNGTGAKKVAPVNMKHEEHQFVIDAYQVEEVLSEIPSTLKIIQAQVLVNNNGHHRKVVVPNALRKLGVSHISERSERRQTSIIVDEISKSALKDKVLEVCKIMNADINKAYFKHIVLSNDQGAVKFQYATKEIKPDETDLRKKLKVLGAILGVGRVQSVINELNAKKYVCHIKEESVKFVMCKKA